MKKWLILGGLGCAIALSIGFNNPSPIKTKAQLGKKLFFDPILSKDHTISCASCHIPANGFADTLAISLGVNASPGSRNAPTVMNLRGHDPFFWDGRAASLEEQALMPISNPVEMDLPITEAIKRLNNSKAYKQLFVSIFKQLPSPKNLGLALAAYQNTLETDESAFDLDQMSASAERGRQLFVSDKTKCFDCHNGPDFTNDEFKNIGLYDGINLTDEGRYTITKNKDDIGKFKTPGLRNIAVTAPYMHNGMFKTLEEVVEYYDNPYQFVAKPINIDSTLRDPLKLTIDQKKDLVNFLKALTDKQYLKKAQ
ncbi:cytochrome c peroxidase [Sediminibacterium sp.]|uniref:cytochrome-c peroxidase n=1 Tax=Sediminibacterium sp. TaxID=1917865 RepID=UPI0025E2C98B|nr:cytochrome c peroxidase [Sediminibacterium sp.]